MRYTYTKVLHPYAAPPPGDPYFEAVRARRGAGYEPPPGSRPSDVSATHLHRLATALGLPHYAFGAANEAGFFGRYAFGNCILSRVPLRDVRTDELRAEPSDLTLGPQRRTPDDLEDRAVTSARVELIEGRHLGICVTHLDHRAEELRAKQAAAVAVHAEAAFARRWGAEAELPAVPFVLMGDMNSFDRRDLSEEGWAAICNLYASKGWPPPRPDSLVRRELMERAGMADAWAVQAAERLLPPPTCWTETRLDYVLLSRAAASGPEALRVRAHRTIASTASDHLPVVVDLDVELAGPAGGGGPPGPAWPES